jgi:hypothetical protein
MNTNIDYVDIGKKAWAITWRNKGLWVLGFLASFLNGGGGSSGSGGGGNGGSGSGGRGFPPNFEQQLMRFWEQYAVWLVLGIVGVIVIVFLISLFFVALGLIGRGGLLRSSQLAQANGSVTLGQGFAAGREELGRLFGIWAITELPVGLLGLLSVIGLLVFGFSTFMELVKVNPDTLTEIIRIIGPLLACAVPLICVLMILGFVAGVLNHMGTLAGVFEGLNGMAAVQRGWAILRENLSHFIIVGIALALVPSLIGFVAVILLFVLIFSVVGLLCCPFYLIFLFVAGAVLQTWLHIYWGLFYQTLYPKPVVQTMPFSAPLPVA